MRGEDAQWEKGVSKSIIDDMQSGRMGLIDTVPSRALTLANEIERSVRDAEKYGFPNIVINNILAHEIISALIKKEPAKKSIGDYSDIIAELKEALGEALGSWKWFVSEHDTRSQIRIAKLRKRFLE